MYAMVVAQVLPLLLLKSILILDIVIRLRYDKDDGEDGDKDKSKDDAESNTKPNTHPNLNHTTKSTLFITAHSYCNTILHHLHNYLNLNYAYHPHHL